jgi:tetratricopeptide (TPR) repeat protein
MNIKKTKDIDMGLNIDLLLQQGVSAHQAGNLQEAERCYKNILQTQSTHPHANHNLGALYVSINKSETALNLFKTALQVNPNIELFWMSYINVLINERLFTEAKQALKKAKRKGANKNKLNDLNQYLISQVNRSSPPQSDIDRLTNYYQDGNYDDAETLAKSITEQFPKYPFGWKILGATLQKSGKISEALNAMQQSAALNSEDAEAYNNLGVTLQELSQFEEAEESYRKAIVIQPNFAQAHDNLGNTLKDLGRLKEAELSYKQALVLKPDFGESHYNLGILLEELSRFEEAEKSYRQAIFFKQNFALAHNNLGNTLKDLGRLKEAELSYKQALVLQPDLVEAYYNISFSYNLKGDLQEGLKLYEWRLKKKGFKTRTPRKNFIWDGSKSVLRKRFLVYEEQGLGDAIQFCRYLPLLKQKGAQVTFEVKQKMHALLHTIGGDIVFVDSYPDDNKIDFEAPLMSLPFLFNTNLDTIPSRIPYLFPDHDKAASWGNRLTKATFKVGICWQGSKNKIDFGRSFPLSLFKGISQLPNVELISLHKGEGEKQIKDINFEMTTLGDDFDAGEDAFIDTAAVMVNCDIIITSDTALAHLAGALGCRTWVALKKIPDWRWMLYRNDSPWYPNMTLYRQKERGNWKYVFDTMQTDLQSLLKQEKSIK